MLKLEQMNALMVPAILRCAFTASICSDEPWRISEEDKAKNRAAYLERIAKRIEEELAWLAAAELRRAGVARIPATKDKTLRSSDRREERLCSRSC